MNLTKFINFFLLFPLIIKSHKYFKEKYYVKHSHLFYTTKLNFYNTNYTIENVFIDSYVNLTEIIDEKSKIGEYLITDNNMIHFNYKEFIDLDANTAISIPFFENEENEQYYFLNQLKLNKLIENKTIFFIPSNYENEKKYFDGISDSIEGEIYYGGIDDDLIKNRDKIICNINNTDLIINFEKILFEGYENINEIIGINNIIITPSPYLMSAPKTFIKYFNNTFLKNYYNKENDCKIDDKDNIICKVKVIEKLPKLKIYFDKNKFLFIEIKYLFFLTSGYLNNKERYLTFLLKQCNKYFRFGYVIMKNNITELNIDKKQIVFYGDYFNNNNDNLYNFFNNKNIIFTFYIVVLILNLIGIINIFIFKLLFKI